MTVRPKPPTPVGTCSTGKKRFVDEEQAERARLAAVETWKLDGRMSGLALPMNVHACEVCGGAHWTKNANKRWAAGKGGRKNPRKQGRGKRR